MQVSADKNLRWPVSGSASCGRKRKFFDMLILIILGLILIANGSH